MYAHHIEFFWSVGVTSSKDTVLPARRYAIAGTSYGPVSVSVSVGHKSVFYQNE